MAIEHSLCTAATGIAQPDVPTGSELAGYRIERLLGEGGQARVYLAREPGGQQVALKLPHPEGAEQLLREASVGSALRHPNIVPVYGVVRQGDRAAAVVEYCPGGSLADLMQEHPEGLPLRRVRAIATDVLAGLEAAHQAGFLHRDLKPSNVLFDAAAVAKIADLGLALQTGEGLEHSLARSHALPGAGTPLYWAPEQEDPELLDGAGLDPRADLYSFGKLLYVMLTGASPRTIVPPTRLRPKLDPLWEELVFVLLEQDRERRPADVEKVRHALLACSLGAAPAQPARRALGFWGVLGRVFAVVGGLLSIVLSAAMGGLVILGVSLTAAMRGCSLSGAGSAEHTSSELAVMIGTPVAVAGVCLAVFYMLVRVFRRR